MSKEPAPVKAPPLTRRAVALRLIAWLEKNDIPNCLVGDTRKFPEGIQSDVDIVVAQEALPRLPQVLWTFCREHQLRLIQAFQHELTAWYYTLAWFDEAENPVFLNPDICGNYFRIGRFYLHSAELLENRRPVRTEENGHSETFHIAAPARNFIYYLIKKIDKQDLSAGSGAYLSSLWQADSEAASRNIRRFWPQAEADLLIRAAQTGQWETIMAALPQFQRALRGTRSRSPKNRMLELARKARRALCPTGLMVVALGPDGSGKSSVIDGTLRLLSPAFRRVKRYHLRPHLGRKPSPGSVVVEPHAKKPYGAFVSSLKLLYLWVDYTAGYFGLVYRQLAASTLVVFDRYYQDLLVDPRRYRFGGSVWLANRIGKLIPRPDLWLVLDAPASILQQRKQEVPLEETDRQTRAYRELARKLPHALVIDAAQPLDRVVSQAARAVVETLGARLERRFRLPPPP